LRSSLLSPGATRGLGVVPPGLRGIGAYLTFSELAGRLMSPAELRERVARFNWRTTLITASSLAAAICNSGGIVSQIAFDLTFGALAQGKPETEDAARIVHAIRDPALRQRPIVHEEVLSMFQAMVIAWASDDGPTPTTPEMVTLILATNDHLDRWNEPDVRQLTDQEELVADLTHMARFNWQKDLASSIVRSSHVFSEMPLRGPHSSAEAWTALQIAAFGCTFREYISRFSLPLALLSSHWGTRNNEGSIIAPTFSVRDLFAETMVDDAITGRHVAKLCADREELREKIVQSARPDGMPAAPALFYHTPFVKLDASVAVALSPWIVREQLKNGLWGQFRGAVSDSTIWLRTFGDVFELWARRIARRASAKDSFAGTLLLSEVPGTGEIEDVVVRGQNAAALFSVKASLMSVGAAREHRSRSRVIDWYERFFFAEANPQSKEHRAAGAVRLLDQNVRRVRRGETTLPSDIYILPVIVSFDDLCESSMLNRWIDKKCREYGLLSQPGVAPLAIMEPGEYEGLFALGARGTSPIYVLRLKASGEWRERNMDALLYQLCRKPGELRSPEFDADYDDLNRSLWQRLFGKEPPPRVGLVGKARSGKLKRRPVRKRKKRG
jgi:hypothetical protein